MHVSRVSFDVMFTRMEVLLFDEKSAVDKAFNEIEKETFRLEKMFNRFDELSELSRLNRMAGSGWAEVSDELTALLLQSRELKERSLGYFDVTRNATSWNAIQFDKKKGVCIEKESINFDLGGIAKGYALDKIRAIFSKYGLKNAFVSFGESSILAWGTHPAGDHWPLGAKDFFLPEKVVHPFKVRNGVLSGSSTMQRRDGELLAHLINPHTGNPVNEHRVSSVVTTDGIEGEAMATALAVAETEEEREQIVRNFPEAEACVWIYTGKEITHKTIYNGR